MSVVDLLALVLVVLGVLRGRKRGLPVEAYRLVRLLIALLLGCGLYSVISAGVGKVLSLKEGTSAPLVFVLTVAGSWWALRMIKRRFMDWVAARFEKYSRIGGAVAGGLRTALLILGVVGAITLARWLPGNEAIRENTVVGKIAGWAVRAE